jgi:hypothetical protein
MAGAATPGILLEGETSSDRWRHKLHLRKRDFPGTSDPEAREAIERGKLVHRVLASGATEARAIEAFLASAHAPAKVRTDAKAILVKLLAHPDIAPLVRPSQGSTVESEVTLLDAKGELEKAQLTIGLSDGENAQIIQGAKEGDVFVVRSTSTSKPASAS